MKYQYQKISLKDSCDLIGKSKDIFTPIKEAVTNSLDAIYQRQKMGVKYTPIIILSIHFKTTKNMFNEDETSLDYISIEDNGIGFTTENFSRFKTLGENTKNMNNRGTGKIQIFSRFNKMSIQSVFYEANKWYELSADWKITGEYNETKPIEINNQSDCKTLVTMSDISCDKNEQDFFLRYYNNIEDLKKDILKRFLLRLHIGITNDKLNFNIQLFNNNKKQGEFKFNKNNIPSPDMQEKIVIDTEQANFISNDDEPLKIEWNAVDPKHELTINRFKLNNTDMDENGIFMCSKNIVVESFKFPIVRKNASFNGYRYLTSINGDLLDDPMNVNQAVDGFNFPIKKKIESQIKDDSRYLFNQENKFVFWEEIKNKINHGLSKTYSDVEGIKVEKEKNIIELANKYGIPKEDAEVANVEITDTEEEATEKLFETQAKRLAKQSIEIQKTYNEIKKLETQKLDPTSKQYRERMGELTNKLLEKIPQQNKDELTRYIIRRDMVVELIKLTLNNDLAIQKEWAKKKAEGIKVRQDNEGIIHDIIFKRRMKGVPNDLWVLNEEFVHFDGYSDIELDKLEVNNERLLKDNIIIDDALKAVGIKKESYLKQRPDIFLFPEEGKCILIEFKAKDVEVTDYCDQIQRYARLIANFSRKTFDQFYGFFIGEQIDKVSMPGRYIKAPYGNYWYYPSEPIKAIDENEKIISYIYQEIIPISEIGKRAEIRNRSFAEKLGITSSDIKKVKEEIEKIDAQ